MLLHSKDGIILILKLIRCSLMNLVFWIVNRLIRRHLDWMSHDEVTTILDVVLEDGWEYSGSHGGVYSLQYIQYACHNRLLRKIFLKLWVDTRSFRSQNIPVK